jgi:hypothetical protein
LLDLGLELVGQADQVVQGPPGQLPGGSFGSPEQAFIKLDGARQADFVALLLGSVHSALSVHAELAAGFIS